MEDKPTGPDAALDYSTLSAEDLASVTRLQLLPSSGPVRGGSTVNVTGVVPTGQTVMCRFGQSNAGVQGSLVSTSMVRCRAPAHGVGLVNLQVSADGVVYSSSTGGFEYVQDADVIGLRPSAGPETGGVEVTVIGTKFEGWREMQCRFGRLESLGDVISSSLMRCVVPEQASGVVMVQVSNCLLYTSPSPRD